MIIYRLSKSLIFLSDFVLGSVVPLLQYFESVQNMAVSEEESGSL
jgi:hypothetical protein